MDDKKTLLSLIGRLRQRDYVLWQLLFGISALVLLAFRFAVGFIGFPTNTQMMVIMYAFISVEIYLTAKRLHDCNFSGWFSLLLLFNPVIIYGVLFMCIYPGTKGANKYGEDPREDNSGNHIEKHFTDGNY